MKQRPWRSAAYSLLSKVCWPAFLHNPGPLAEGWHCSESGLDLPTSTINQGNALQTCPQANLMKAFSQLGVLFRADSSLGQVDNKQTKTTKHQHTGHLNCSHRQMAQYSECYFKEYAKFFTYQISGISDTYIMIHNNSNITVNEIAMKITLWMGHHNMRHCI